MLTSPKVIRSIFCAHEQAHTDHLLVLDRNREVVATCQAEGCGHFIKFPLPDTPEQLSEILDRHHKDNVGQVSALADQQQMDDYDKRFRALMGIGE